MTAKREMTFLLADVERSLLRVIARRLPASLQPDHLSAIGVLGAVGAGAAYALSASDVRWLWVGSLMLVVNWFGDSLDGTLARVRRTERPKYGYYLDHLIDAFSTVVVGVGIGLSPFVHFEVALALVIVYLMLSINVYLESSVLDVFKMAYGVFGPTEARLVLITGNAVLAFTVLNGAVPAWIPLVTNIVLGTLGGVMCGMLALRFGRNLRELSRSEPPRPEKHSAPFAIQM